MKLIDKDALVAEIERLKLCTMDEHMNFYSEAAEGEYHALSNLESFIDTLEVKEVDFWHKQSEEDIDDSINDWSLHTYLCLMIDGSIQRFTGILDESYDGSINIHLDCTDDNYDWEYDNIIYWIETLNVKAQKGEEV